MNEVFLLLNRVFLRYFLLTIGKHFFDVFTYDVKF